MECIVKNTDIGFARECGLGALNTLEVGRVVQRCQVDEGADAILHLLIHQNALVENISTLYDPVANGRNVVRGVYDLGVPVHEKFADFLKCGSMVLQFAVIGNGCAVGLTFHMAACPYSLTVSLGQDGLVLHFYELEFQRRAAAVDDQNFHERFPPTSDEN